MGFVCVFLHLELNEVIGRFVTEDAKIRAEQALADEDSKDTVVCRRVLWRAKYRFFKVYCLGFLVWGNMGKCTWIEELAYITSWWSLSTCSTCSTALFCFPLVHIDEKPSTYVIDKGQFTSQFPASGHFLARMEENWGNIVFASLSAELFPASGMLSKNDL